MPPSRLFLLPASREPFPGWVNVQEVPGELGGTLLLLQRAVLLWAETPADERERLFGAERAEDPRVQLDTLDVPEDLMAALRDVATVRRDPEGARAAAVSRACDAVSAWAEARGSLGTAIAWARAAAVAYPANVAAAYRVGLLARRRADYPTAEAWLQHAGGLARRHGDWTTFALSLNGLGNLHVQRGEFPAGRAVLDRALRAAQRPRGRVQGERGRLRQLEGEILHDLMTVSVYAGDFPGAERFAAEAYERMRSGHRRLPVLAHDVAGLWMERGYFGRALPVFEAVLPHIRPPRERVRVVTNLLRAAGAAGRDDAFDRYAAEALSLLESLGAAEAPAASWTCLARGASSLGRWEIAEQAALQALETAMARKEADQCEEIPPLLDSIRRHRYADAPPEPASPWEERAARALAAGLVESLGAMRAGE